MSIIQNFDFSNIVPSCFYMVNRYCDESWYVPPAKRDFHNFMLVVSGKGTSITDGKEYAMSPGMLVYHHVNQSFGYTSSNPDFMHVFGVNFYVSSISCDNGIWSVTQVDRLPFNTFTKMTDMDILAKYFTTLNEVWVERKINYQLKCRSIFSNILHEIYRQIIMQQENAHAIQTIESAISYIRKNYNRNITLESLASLSGLNPNYFGSIFKKYTGQTPMEYVNYVRIEKAEEYLLTGYTITETSALAGFADPFYFSKVFKKFKGVSPREYMKTPLSFY